MIKNEEQPDNHCVQYSLTQCLTAERVKVKNSFPKMPVARLFAVCRLPFNPASITIPPPTAFLFQKIVFLLNCYSMYSLIRVPKGPKRVIEILGLSTT